MSDAPSKLKVAAVVGFYMAAALVMVLVNKAVLNSTPELPYSFLLMQMILTVALLQLSAKLLPSILKVEPLTYQLMKDILPLTLVGLAGLVFNTLCLRSVDTTFFQIARGLVLPMTIGVSAISTRKAPRRNVVVAALIVTVGFMIGVSPSAFLSSSSSRLSAATLDALSIGLIYGVLSSLLTAVHAVMRKHQVEKLPSIVQVAYASNVMCAIVLLPLILMNNELPAIRRVILFENPDETKVFWLGSAVTGLFGLFLSLAGLLSIKVTSPVAHMFSSAARNVLQTLLGIAIFGDVLTSNRFASLSCIIAGTLYFTYISTSPASAKPWVPPPNEKSPSDLEKQ